MLPQAAKYNGLLLDGGGGVLLLIGAFRRITPCFSLIFHSDGEILDIAL